MSGINKRDKNIWQTQRIKWILFWVECTLAKVRVRMYVFFVGNFQMIQSFHCSESMFTFDDNMTIATLANRLVHSHWLVHA